jgi:methionyl-tRNA formyltransferase
VGEDTWEKPTRAPGEVLELGDEGFTVQTGLGRILVKRVQSKEAGKVGAAEFAKTYGLKPGDILESILPSP